MIRPPLPVLTLADLADGDRFDSGEWILRDGALGAAWTVRATVAGLQELVTNFLWDADFGGAYLQILWGAAASNTVVVTLKAYLPRVETSWTTAADQLFRRDVTAQRTRRHSREAGRAAFVEQRLALEEVATLASLRPRRLIDPAPLRDVRRAAFGEGSDSGAVDHSPGTLSPVASLRRRPTLALEELPVLLENRPGVAMVRTLTFVQRTRTGHVAEGWLYPLLTAPAVTFQHLERGWARDGYRLVPERALEFAARMFLLPFGAVPALESDLAPCAIRVQMGNRPLPPHAVVRNAHIRSVSASPTPSSIEPSAWAA